MTPQPGERIVVHTKVGDFLMITVSAPPPHEDTPELAKENMKAIMEETAQIAESYVSVLLTALTDTNGLTIPEKMEVVQKLREAVNKALCDAASGLPEQDIEMRRMA